MEIVSDFIFGGSQITAGGDCSHEIKRRLLLGRKGMINLDSILKSRDITLPVKDYLVKAMVFPVVMYGLKAGGVRFSSVQFSSAQLLSRVRLCDPMNRSTPGLPVHHQLLEFTQTHVHRVGEAIQPSYPLLSPSPPGLNLSQHQGLFQWVNSSHEVAKVLEFQLQHQSFQWTPRTDLL